MVVEPLKSVSQKKLQSRAKHFVLWPMIADDGWSFISMASVFSQGPYILRCTTHHSNQPAVTIVGFIPVFHVMFLAGIQRKEKAQEKAKEKEKAKAKVKASKRKTPEEPANEVNEEWDEDWGEEWDGDEWQNEYDDDDDEQ